MSEYDQRQYRLMLDALDQFEKGRIPIDVLVNDLEGLLAVLEEVLPAWKNEFQKYWAGLDDARAVALDEARTFFDEATSRRLLARVSELKRLVLDRIDDAV